MVLSSKLTQIFHIVSLKINLENTAVKVLFSHSHIRVLNATECCRLILEYHVINVCHNTLSNCRAQEAALQPIGTITVTFSLTDIAEFSATSLTACIPDHSPAGRSFVSQVFCHFAHSLHSGPIAKR